jgi:ribonuclease Y
LLGARGEVALRAGLLHEIGQVEDGNGAGVHPILIAADLATKFGEEVKVAQAIRALHQTGSEPSIEAVLLKVAEKIVVARPGERDDNLEVFIERLRSLEEIASSFGGVARVYAMRAGKEVRVIVEPQQLSDADAVWLSKDISRRISQELRFPGTIRVNVIRETRAVDYAT